MTGKFIFRPVLSRTIAVLALVLWAALSAAPAAAQGVSRDDDSREDSRSESGLTGRLLVATPNLRDPNFRHTVIYMVSHDEDGAMGIVINRLATIGPLAEVMRAFGIKAPPDAGEIRVFSGGPVQRGVGFILHSTDYTLEETLVVSGEIALTAHTKILSAISRGEGPAEKLLAFGYAGWGPGQLEDEIEADAWYTVTANSRFVFDKELETKWQRAVDLRGLDL
jgi:putative transcriptional regulator